jgi:hypothetical protein
MPLLWASAARLVAVALAVDPQTPATLCTGTWGGVFRSTNGQLEHRQYPP